MGIGKPRKSGGTRRKTETPGPRRLALLIGNGRVDAVDGGAPCLDLPGIDKDLDAMAAVLGDAETAGFEIARFFEPTLIEARREIARIARAAGADDTLLIYYSGTSFVADDGQLYLPMRDSDNLLLDATCLDADFVLGQLRRSRCRRIVILLDGCHSGAFFAHNRGVPDGFFAITSCSASEVCYGDAEGGAFTRLMVEALRGARADSDGDGAVSTDELFRYVLPRAQQGKPFPATTPQRWSWNLPEPIILTHVRRKIFLSYRRADAAVADQITAALEAEGFAVWVDREDIGGGTRWRNEIERALQAAHAVVFLMSASAIESDEVYKELHRAIELGKPIVPLQLEAVKLIGWHKAELGAIQAIGYDAGDAERRWMSALIRAVRLASTEAPSPPTPETP